MSNEIANIIFCCRNSKKVEEGKVDKLPVVLGQSRNAIDSIMKFDNAVGRTAKNATEKLAKAAENDKLIEYAGKGVDFLSKHVNPVICATSGIKVLTSDDKQSAFIQESTALSGMFIAEGLMKENLKKLYATSKVRNLEAKVLKATRHAKGGKMIPGIIKGTIFVVGSTSGYALGESFGKLLTKKKTQETAAQNS